MHYHAHQDAGTVISAVRTRGCSHNLQVRRYMMITPTAGVVETHIDNFAETCQTNRRPKSIFFRSR